MELCHHVRMRGSTGYGVNVEKFIKTLESKYNIDLTTMPQWKQIVRRFYESDTHCKRKIQNAKLRKKIIIEKLYIETTRLSPFELSLNLARTAKTWETLSKTQKTNIPTTNTVVPEMSTAEYEEVHEETNSYSSTAHPNTEEVVFDISQTDPLKSDLETDIVADEVSHLPFYVIVNQHKKISPLSSKDSALSYKSIFDEFDFKTKSDIKEWLSLNETSVIKLSFPQEILITKNIPKEQRIGFGLVNCSTDSFYLQFKCVTDKSQFNRVKIVPDTPIKLYPGITAKFNFIFKLTPNERSEEFSSALFFKVGQNVHTDSLTQACLIPVFSRFMEPKSVSITKYIYFTPKYSWHINGKCGYPTGLIKITVHNNKKYILRIIKKPIDFVKDSIESLSVDVAGPNTESLIERIESSEPTEHSKIVTPSRVDLPLVSVEAVESLKTIDFIALFLDEIVCLAMEPFIFEHTYLILDTSSYKMLVYFTEAEHIGHHQCYYDFNFCDTDTENVLITRTVLLLAEVLPHPIQVCPLLLDMSQSPIVHGFCEDRIFISNTHKVYQVTAKIKLTTKMQRLFRLTPAELSVAPGLQGHFHVRLCSREFKKENDKKCEDLAHFTVKIIFSGHKTVYHNIPPLYYEIIAPCAVDFKAVYNENYFKEIDFGGLQENSSV